MAAISQMTFSNAFSWIKKGPIDNNTALVQMMAWCCTGNKPLSEPLMASVGGIYASLCLNELTWGSVQYKEAFLSMYIVFASAEIIV